MGRVLPISAEAIARMADQGKDISRFFTNDGKMVYPERRVNLDMAPQILAQVDEAARKRKISCHAAIMELIQAGLERPAARA